MILSRANISTYPPICNLHTQQEKTGSTGSLACNRGGGRTSSAFIHPEAHLGDKKKKKKDNIAVPTNSSL